MIASAQPERVPILLALAAALLLLSACGPAQVRAAAQGTATETVLLSGGSWCSAQRPCMGLLEWNELVPEQVLRDSLAIGYHYYPEWRSFARTAALQRTRVLVKPAGAGLAYLPGENAIVVEAPLLREASSVQAAVLAHEVVHAASPTWRGSSRSAADCVEEEMRAYSWQAAMWLRVRRGFETSGWASRLHTIVHRWQAGTLREMVLSEPLYHRVCLGRELPSY